MHRIVGVLVLAVLVLTLPATALAKSEVGKSRTLKGIADNEVVKVKLLAVRDPAPDHDFFEPGEGNRFVLVRLKITNVGKQMYSDYGSNGAVLVAGGGSYKGEASSVIDPVLGNLDLRTGQSATGWVMFELPRRAKLQKLKYTPNSGFGKGTGTWKLK